MADGDQGRRHLPRQLQGGQPLSTTKAEEADEAPPRVRSRGPCPRAAEHVAGLEAALVHEQSRAATPWWSAPCGNACPAAASSTFAFRVADCEGYVTVGEYEDGRPGEVFMKVSKQGSTLAGIMDAFSISVSLGLQHGVPLATYVRKYTNMRFEPAGITDDPELRIATSLVDYIFRRLAVDYLPSRSGPSSACSRRRADAADPPRASRRRPPSPAGSSRWSAVDPVTATVIDGSAGDPSRSSSDEPTAQALPGGPGREFTLARAEPRDAPYCYQCGNAMQRAGSCYVCASCGTTSGCS